ncbi:MAG: hypothetical protein M1826_006623 [Phylliscum demangeonii]|nr:MAG: hypothetical protein M1826_006623 [Phylliscum demangeonii]
MQPPRPPEGMEEGFTNWYKCMAKKVVYEWPRDLAPERFDYPTAIDLIGDYLWSHVSPIKGHPDAKPALPLEQLKVLNYFKLWCSVHVGFHFSAPGTQRRTSPAPQQEWAKTDNNHNGNGRGRGEGGNGVNGSKPPVQFSRTGLLGEARTFVHQLTRKLSLPRLGPLMRDVQAHELPMMKLPAYEY